MNNKKEIDTIKIFEQIDTVSHCSMAYAQNQFDEHSSRRLNNARDELKQMIRQIMNENKLLKRQFPDIQKPEITSGHCQQRKNIGGCQLHNIQCGYPTCDQKIEERNNDEY
jgi:hypothetical protein